MTKSMVAATESPVIRALRREIAGYVAAAERKGIDPDRHFLIRALKRALAKEMGR